MGDKSMGKIRVFEIVVYILGSIVVGAIVYALYINRNMKDKPLITTTVDTTITIHNKKADTVITIHK